jgi:uncharacterized small protein (DUF1192 family)
MIMATLTVEERLTHLEAEMDKVKSELNPVKRPKNPWATFGIMAGSKHYDEIVRLGAEYRQQKRDRVLEESKGKQIP